MITFFSGTITQPRSPFPKMVFRNFRKTFLKNQQAGYRERFRPIVQTLSRFKPPERGLSRAAVFPLRPFINIETLRTAFALRRYPEMSETVLFLSAG